MVVFRPADPPDGPPARRRTRASARVAPSSLRTPATTRPVAGSITSPTALTATRAATTSPLGSVMEALPTPPFIARPIPASLPTVAPAPAPTLPDRTGSPVAPTAAWYPHSGPGRTVQSPPTPRSYRMAALTIGTRTTGPTGYPTPCSSR